MNLPPTLQAIFDEYTTPGDEVPEVVWRLCSEACRLQREADLDNYRADEPGYRWPLVVQSTES